MHFKHRGHFVQRIWEGRTEDNRGLVYTEFNLKMEELDFLKKTKTTDASEIRFVAVKCLTESETMLVFPR